MIYQIITKEVLLKVTKKKSFLIISHYDKIMFRYKIIRILKQNFDKILMDEKLY